MKVTRGSKDIIGEFRQTHNFDSGYIDRVSILYSENKYMIFLVEKLKSLRPYAHIMFDNIN